MTKAECIEQIRKLLEMVGSGKVCINAATTLARLTIDEYASSVARNIAMSKLRGELDPNYPVKPE